MVTSVAATTRSKAKSNSYPALPRLETLHYFAAYCVVVVGGIGTLLPLSKEKEAYYVSYDMLSTGWYRWIGRHKDTGDFEWKFWESCFFVSVFIGFVGHFITARIADKVCPKYRYDVYCVYSIIFSLYYLQIPGFLFLLTHFLIQYIVMKLTKSTVACWTSGVLLGCTLTSKIVYGSLKSFYPEDRQTVYFILFTTGLCNLRYISFSLEYLWSLSDEVCEKSQNINTGKLTLFAKLFRTPCSERKNVVESNFSFKDLMVYAMYYPLCYGGPVMNYNDFFLQTKKPPLSWDLHNIYNFIFGMAKFLLLHVILDIFLHFFYVSAVASDSALVERLPLFTILGLGGGTLAFFCIKYISMYGLTSHFSSSDNLDAPGPPHFLFLTHRFTDTWKNFDKGLHKWIVRYIFIPLGGSRVSLWRLVLNSIVPFGFIFLWHGMTEGQWHWACLSWLGVVIESICYQLYKTDFVQSVEKNYLTMPWSRRIRAFLSAPIMGLLMISNLFFLWEVDIVFLFCKRLCLENFQFFLTLWLFFYACCQTCMEFHRMGVGM